MSDERSPAEVFLALVNGLCQGRLDEVVDLYAETTDVSHPFDPLRGHGFTSREELHRHFTGRPLQQTFKARPQNIRIHETRDPEVIVAEFEYAIDDLETRASSSYPCIFVMRVRNGKIVSSRDYVDHLGSAEARGRLGDLLSEIGTRRSGPA
jgi:ketosteroid isomerase-like protein